MGEYADDYFRKQVKAKFGFDPDSMYSISQPRRDKTPCKVCGKKFGAVGMKDHVRDVHTPLNTQPHESEK